MHGTLVTIKVDGTITQEDVTGKVPLEKLQKAVGGYIERVPRLTQYEGHRCVAFCNEDGKLDGLTLNETAHELWEDSVGRVIQKNYLVGDIAIVYGDDAFMRSL